MIKARIDRLSDNGKQTAGLLSVYINNQQIFNCKTLELPWKDNIQSVSCIPLATYKVRKRISSKFDLHFHILDVPNRSHILIHPANFVRQLLGCVAVGENWTDIDGDGLRDVINSKATLKKLLSILPEEFEITIVNNYLK
jgi:hypothetical protein